MTEPSSYFVIEVPDAGLAKQFYGSLLGWQFEPGTVPGGYQIVSQAGGLLGNAPQAKTKIYFETEDIRAALQRVRQLGGDHGALEQTTSGFRADCRDDQGTEFSLHQSRTES